MGVSTGGVRASATSDPTRRRWSQNQMRALVGAVHGIIFAPLIIQAVYHPDRWVGPDDYTTHLVAALPETWRQPWVPGPPHFVWHSLVKGSSAILPGSGYLLGAVVVSVAFAALAGVVWFEVLHMRGPSGTRMRARWAAVGSVVLLCMESPATLQGWEAIRDEGAWVPLHAYHGPTGPAARPVAALLVLGFVALASGERSPHYRSAHRWMPLLAVVAAVTKPTMSVVLVPVVLLVGWLWGWQDGRRPWSVVEPVLRRFIAPTVGLVAVQYAIMAFQVPDQYRQETLLRPFEVFLAYDLHRPLFWVVLALPVAMLATWGRRLVADRCVEVCLFSFGTGVGLLMVMSSTNLERDALAALWFMVHPLALFMLFGTRRAAELWRTDRRPMQRYGMAGCVALAALYVFAFADFTSCQLQQACLSG